MLKWLVLGVLVFQTLYAASISFTAIGSGYYRVMNGNTQVSQHITEREALESLANAKLQDPAADLYMYHDYRVEVDVDGVGTVTPPVVTPGDSFPLAWTPPTTRADGTMLPLDQIDGYKVYWGTVSGTYPNTVDIADGTATSTTITGLAPGTYYIVMTTYDVQGMESSYSGEVVKVVQ